jgi:hypothetical protein
LTGGPCDAEDLHEEGSAFRIYLQGAGDSESKAAVGITSS